MTNQGKKTVAVESRITVLAGVVFIMAMVAFEAGAQGIVFSDGFEGTDQQVNTVWGSGASAKRILDLGPSNSSGNHVLRLTMAAGRTQAADGLAKYLSTGYQKLYARWYMKFAQGYNFAAGAWHGSWFGGGSGIGIAGYVPPDGGDRVCYSVETNTAGQMQLYAYYRGMPCARPPGPACFGNIFTDPARPALTVNTWNCVEVMIDVGTPTSSAVGATGAFDLWVNGIHYGPWGGLWLRASSSLTLNTLRPEIYVEVALPSAITILYDDYVVSTQRIGTLNGIGDTTLPAAPTNLRATAVSAVQINLTWTDNASNETGFLVEKKVSPTGAWTQFATTAANVTTCNSTGLGALHTFRYRVRAINNNGRSAYSNIDSATTTAGLLVGAGKIAQGVMPNRWVLVMGGFKNEIALGHDVRRVEVYNIAGRKVWQLDRGDARGNLIAALPVDLRGVLYLKFAE